MKKKWVTAALYLYPAVAVILLTVKNMRSLWADATWFEYVSQFSNLIPLAGIVNAFGNTMKSGNLHYLIPVAFHLILLMPAGLLVGHSRYTTGKPPVWRVCGSYALMLGTMYALRVALRIGSFDLDDLLLNLAGFLVGAGISALLFREKRTVGNDT